MKTSTDSWHWSLVKYSFPDESVTSNGCYYIRRVVAAILSFPVVFVFKHLANGVSWAAGIGEGLDSLTTGLSSDESYASASWLLLVISLSLFLAGPVMMGEIFLENSPFLVRIGGGFLIFVLLLSLASAFVYGLLMLVISWEEGSGGEFFLISYLKAAKDQVCPTLCWELNVIVKRSDGSAMLMQVSAQEISEVVPGRLRSSLPMGRDNQQWVVDENKSSLRSLIDKASEEKRAKEIGGEKPQRADIYIRAVPASHL